MEDFQLIPLDPWQQDIDWVQDLKRDRQIRNLSAKLQTYINVMVYVSVVFLLLDKLF